jgi:hypothetical protein
MRCIILFWKLHCKKGYCFSHPQPGCHEPNSPWPGIIKLFPARESLVSDIPVRVDVETHADFRENFILLTVCQQDALEVIRETKI